jgi:hypothetical protein
VQRFEGETRAWNNKDGKVHQDKVNHLEAICEKYFNLLVTPTERRRFQDRSNPKVNFVTALRAYGRVSKTKKLLSDFNRHLKNGKEQLQWTSIVLGTSTTSTTEIVAAFDVTSKANRRTHNCVLLFFIIV